VYYCYNCDEMFSRPIRIIERHGWTYPPYEELMACPYCGSNDIEERIDGDDLSKVWEPSCD